MNDYKHIISGGVSGLTQSIVGHPFDTIKVWKQVEIKPNYKLQNLYRGISIPLLSNGIINSFLFSINNNLNKSCNNYFISGSISGLVTSPFLHLASLQKIKYQNNVKSKISFYNGFKLGLFRDSLFYGIYFSSYNQFKKEMNEMNLFSEFNNNLISGGLSGCISWLTIYPLDTIRTRLQTHNMNYKKAIQYGNLFNGLKMAMLRAFIVNSVGFYFYELTLLNL
jgi:hypothetical protein